jgi:hypothetical protein
MPDQKQDILALDWAFLFYWLMATTFGWLLGWLLLPTIGLVTAGVGAGIVQCFVLYRRIPRPWRWILATAVGWLAGVAIVIPVVPPGIGLLSGAIIGATTGTAQWWLLRRQVHWAGWWIAVSMLAWAMALAIGLDALPRVVLSGVVAGMMTGLVLNLLLGTPKPAEEDKEE